MNPVFPAQKRAEEFSSMVEASSTAGVTDTGKYSDLVPLVGLVTSLRSQPAPQARPEFVASLRERLMIAAETALVPDTSAQVEARHQPAPRRTTRERRLAVAVGAFAIVSASASMSVAAQSALPGDTLYPLKRALEDVHENVLRSADDRGATMLDNASSRLDEVDELSRSGGQDPEVIARTLQDFADQAAEASSILLSDFQQTGRLSSIAELRSFTATSLDALERLESLVPVEVRAALVQAAQVLDEIDRQALMLCPSCSDLPSTLDAVSSAADLGPIQKLIDDTSSQQTSTTRSPDKAPAKKPAKKPRSTTRTEPEAETRPAPRPDADNPSQKPTEEPQDPSVLTPDTEGTDDETPPSSGDLPEVFTGLGNGDVGQLLNDVTGAVDDVLGTGGDTKLGN